MSQSTAEKKANSEHPSMTTIFWLIIVVGILSISLIAGWLAEDWSTEKSSEPQDKVTSTSQAALNNELISKTAAVWKALAQRVQQTENKTLQVVANALEKLPNLAPLPRPNVVNATHIPAILVDTTQSPPIAWKLLTEQLAVTEQQEVMMLQSFLAKTDK